MSPGHSISLYFPHAGWENRAGNYTVDFRGAYETLDRSDLNVASAAGDVWGHAWRFDVAKNFSEETAGDEVVLEVQGLETVPSEAEVLLVDRHLDRVVHLRERSAYRYFQGKKALIEPDRDARFILIVGSDAFVDSQQLPKLPTRTVLHQNFPNPFNPTTIIRYAIAQAGDVTLRIYDATGALVKDVYRGHRIPGVYEAGWNGDNNQGHKVASGIYFYRLRAVNFTQTRKMVLLK